VWVLHHRVAVACGVPAVVVAVVPESAATAVVVTVVGSGVVVTVAVEAKMLGM
jgi:hypothetical protein